MIARDQQFSDQLQEVSAFVDRVDLEMPADLLAQLAQQKPELKKALPSFRQQPDFGSVMQIMELFRARGVTMSVYEGCEINRWLYEDRERNPPGGMRNLQAYWNALGPFAMARADDAEFQALAGALAVDQHFRFDFVQGGAGLNEINFNLSPTDEQELRNLLQTGGEADLAANRFEMDSWSGSCLQIARPYPGWVHFNG
jgi:hypothetical protein